MRQVRRSIREWLDFRGEDRQTQARQQLVRS